MRVLSLLSANPSPCGVEAFARRLSDELGTRGRAAPSAIRLTGAPSELGRLWTALGQADLVVMNIHYVGWKRVLVQPILALLLARARGRQVLVVLHEWGDLDWKRRVVFAPCLMLATRLMFSSPRVRRQVEASPLGRFLPRRRAIVPIPPNIDRPAEVSETDLSRRLDDVRSGRDAVIGQFGSIYPKKRNLVILEVAAELRRRGSDVFCLFVGSFTGGQDTIESDFWRRVGELGLEGHVLVTGYVDDPRDLFAVLERVDVFVYSFEEGLTSNRSSVLTCLQAGRPVVVNASRLPNEFDHHPEFRARLADDRLTLVPHEAGSIELADAVQAVLAAPVAPAAGGGSEAWAEVVRAVGSFALAPDAGSSGPARSP